jgi:hypothetical protein
VETKALTIPGLEGVNAPINLDITIIQEAESRLIEAKTVNPATYKALEYLYNDGYRQARQHLASVEYQIVRAERQKEREKARVILEVLPEKLDGKASSCNNADFRAAILATDERYNQVCEHIEKLKALSTFFDIRIKVFEKACTYMRKGIDLIIRGSAQTIGQR